jgi:hypothetical protein
MNRLPNENEIFEDDYSDRYQLYDEAEVEDHDRDRDIIQESIEMEPDEISNDEETRTSGTVEQLNELPNEEILSFL